MELTYKKLSELSGEYGDSFYLLDSDVFMKNYEDLRKAFTDIYPNFNIAYSYKTNYIPKLCQIVNAYGGLAEVVSDMEFHLAEELGVRPRNIIRNGPYKTKDELQRQLTLGAAVNLDSEYECDIVRDIARRTAEDSPERRINVGIRCNFDINDGVTSRFGFAVEGEGFRKALELVTNTENIHFAGLQCHFAARALETWEPRARGMLELIRKIGIVPERVDLGGGIYGRMDDSLKAQFSSRIPTYEEYAEVVARPFAECFGGTENPPLLLIEPGTALVGDAMRFVTKVAGIKDVRGKKFATLSGSIYNINPTLNTKNPPLKRYTAGNTAQYYDDLSLCGYTCIESDYLYRHYSGEMAEGDFVVFENAGSYSVVLKPPFIMPNFAVLDISEGETEVIKRREHCGDIFGTYAPFEKL